MPNPASRAQGGDGSGGTDPATIVITIGIEPWVTTETIRQALGEAGSALLQRVELGVSSATLHFSSDPDIRILVDFVVRRHHAFFTPARAKRS